MKKTLLAASVGFITFSGAIFAGTATLAHAQSITLTQLVQLFIQLGIIPSDKAAAAEAAVANMSSGNATTSGYTTTTTVIATTTTNAVPVVSVLGSPNILSSQSPYQNGSSTTTLQSTFYVQIQAIGDNFYFQPASAEPFDFSISRNGVWSDMSAYSHVVSFSVPPAGVITAGLPSDIAFELQQNNRIQLPITFSFLPVGSLSTYKISLTGVKFINSGGNVQTTTAIKGVATQGFTSSGVTQTNTQPSITVTYPQAGYSLDDSGQKNNSQIANIQWNSSGLGSDLIGILLFPPNGTPKTIVATTPNTGSYVWAYDPTLQNGTYQIEVYDAQSKGGDISGNSGYFSITGSPASPIGTQTNPTITPSNQTVSSTQTSSSGQPAVITVTIPSNTVRSQLYLSCPSGLSAKIDGFAGQACNTYLNTTGMGSSFSILFTNSTANPISAVPNFYVYLSSNPNFAVGVSANIVVNPAVQTTQTNTQPSITMLSPVNSASWIQNTVATWTWKTSSGSVPYVDIYLTSSSGISYAFANSYPNSGTFSWRVGSAESQWGVSAILNGNYSVYVCPTTTGGVKNSQCGEFSVNISGTQPQTVPYQINSISPSTASVGNTVTIFGANFNQYSLVSLGNPNGGPESEAIITPTNITSSSITFVVPATNTSQTNSSTVGTNYVQVIANQGQGGGGLSNTMTLNITPQTTQTNTQTNTQHSLTITNPNGGTYQAGSQLVIQWTATGLTTANNSLGLNVYETSLPPSKSILSASVGNPVSNGQVSSSGSYTWTIPSNAPPASDYVIYLSNANSYVQSAPFTITAPPQSLNLSIPISTLPVSASTQTQTSSDVPFVGPVQNPTPAAPAVTSTQTSVSAPSADTNTSSQTSAQTQVQTQSAQTGPVNSISVLSPSTGETLTQGQDYTIRWSTSNLAPSVTTAYILLTNSSGSTITTIASSVPVGQGSYVWNVGSNVYPLLPAGKYKIKVALYYNNTPSALSGIFTLSAPVASAPAPQQTTSFINTLSTIGAAVIGAFHF